MAFHWKFREKYLPVAPTPPPTDSGLQLHLAGASSSNKAYRPAYVMTQGGPYTIHRDVLRAHQGTSLSSKSFGILVTEMGYTEEEDYLREQRVIERKKRKIEKDEEKEKRRALWDQGQAASKQKAEEKRQRQAEYKQKVEEKRQQKQVIKKEKADERMALKIQRMAVKERDKAKVNTKLDKGFFCLMAGICVAILCVEAFLLVWLLVGVRLLVGKEDKEDKECRDKTHQRSFNGIKACMHGVIHSEMAAYPNKAGRLQQQG